MIIVGDKSRFAIEYELDPEPAGEWLNGSIKLWLGGRAVGEAPPTELRSLRDYLFMFEYIVSGEGRRSNVALFVEPFERAVRLLDDSLFTGDDHELEQRATEEQWGLLLLELGFPSGHVYAVESGDEVRLLVSERGVASGEIRLPKREVYDVFNTARDQLETLRARYAS
jgi:hypothetical protein